MGEAERTPDEDVGSGSLSIELDGEGLLAGKYRLDHEIARGGMGSVWRGTHVTLDRPVAIKFVDVGSQQHDRIVERFLREAKTAAAIRHPNVIDIVDFGTTGRADQPFMVMELLEGETLLSRIRRDPALTAREAVLIMAQVLSGLDAVHRAGIVHRDLKPANVFVSHDEEGGEELFARLLDFGISYSVDPDSELRRGRFGTSDQLVIGTPEYMSPEQAEGRPDIDLRADVYAAGVMLYEMLTGVLPFDAEHPGAVLNKVMNGDYVPLEQLRPDLPELATVVAAAMARDRDARPQSARELRRMILSASGMTAEHSGQFATARISGTHRKLPASDPPPRVARDAPTQTFDPVPVAPTRSRAPWVAAAVIVVIAAIAGVGWALTRGAAETVATAPAPSALGALPTPPPPAPSATAPTAPITPPAVVEPSAPQTTPAPSAVATPEEAHHHRRRGPAASEPATGEAPATSAAPTAPAGPRTVVHDLDF
jgi:serine/threonine-protein kinase